MSTFSSSIRPFLAVAALVSCASVMAAEQLCRVTVRPEKFGYRFKPLGVGETRGCGAFLYRSRAAASDAEVLGVSVVAEPAETAIKNYPSNFVMLPNGTLQFRLPEDASDHRTVYETESVRVIRQRAVPVGSGRLIAAEYEQRVRRLEPSGPAQELEVKKTERCVDVVRYTSSATLFVGGCVDARDKQAGRWARNAIAIAKDADMTD